ncbi:MAG: hypothetical protein M0R46_01595 [Candidatus Muirbacterium halophilum]|nr:hypothetical protein [Candidatus Muirbacterium halophilum]
MKKWILVFIATAGSLYSLFSTTVDCQKLYCAPEYARNTVKTQTNIDKKIISYKNIQIHAPIIKDFDKIEIIGIDRAELPIVYYKYNNDIKTAKLNDIIDKNYQIINVEDNSVIIKDIVTSKDKKYNF